MSVWLVTQSLSERYEYTKMVEETADWQKCSNAKKERWEDVTWQVILEVAKSLKIHVLFSGIIIWKAITRAFLSIRRQEFGVLISGH